MAVVTEWVPNVAPPTETKAKLQRIGGRFGLPWPKTRVGNPLFKDELVIVNRTGLRWYVYLDWHALDALHPYETRTVQRGKTGRISARDPDGAIDSGFLLVELAPQAHGVEILDTSGGEGFFELRLLDKSSAKRRPHPDSSPISELDLSPKVQNALETAGIHTFGQIRHAEAAVLLDIVNLHRDAQDELIRLMYMCRRGL